MIKHASLFSGIGGFDLAAKWMGWQNILQCEIDPFCQKVLQFYHPTTQLYGDIRELDGTKYKGQIDVLTGGFPCQPFSAAGRRRGTEDNRFLWPAMLRVIREVQPTWIVAENVRGITSIDNGMVFERVCAELEANGYEVQPFCIPACAVGAPHRRERIWFIAHSPRIERERGEREGGSGMQPETPIGNGNCNATNTESVRRGYGFTKNKKSPTTHEHTPSNKNGISGGWHETWLQAATRLCRVDDGLPRELHGITVPKWRKESLKAYGNAIVPQVAYQIFLSLPL